jgi:Tol biopolymer transport system component
MSRWYAGWREAEMRSKLPLIALAIALAVLGGALPAAAGDRPTNGRISFARFDPELGAFSIWAANPDGTHQRRLTHLPSHFSDWSPDGRRIAFDFEDDTGVHIATMNPNGHRVRQLTFGPAIQEIPDWSPDGRWIAFNAAPVFPGEPGFHTDIWIMRADGSHKRQLTRGAFDDEPVFSPDGRRIAFGRRTQDADIPEIAIYVMNRDGTHQREVVPETLGLAHPDWSPDGRWIAFNIAPEVPGGGVMAVRPDGSGLHVIRRNNSRWEVYKPTWSPDGRKLLVVCYEVQVQLERLCTMNPNGRNLQVVVATPDFVNFPAWGTHPPKH